MFLLEPGRSKNGLFVFSVDPQETMIDGSREKEIPGKMGLFKQGELLWHYPCKNIDLVFVSDNGFCLITEPSKSGKKFNLRAFNQKGKEVYNKSFQGFIRNINLSFDENFVCLITLEYDVVLIDLTLGKILFKKPLSLISQPDYFEIDGPNERVRFVFSDLGKFSWDFKGNFVDTDLWINTVLEKGDASAVIGVVTELLGEYFDLVDRQLTLKILAALDYCLRQDFQSEDKYYVQLRAALHRYKGECFELLNEPQKAIASYETALSLNPKVGVQKRLVSLKKANSLQT